jgi:autotransporter-associated beta strand protein
MFGVAANGWGIDKIMVDKIMGRGGLRGGEVLTTNYGAGQVLNQNSSIIQDGNNIRIQCTIAGGTARLLINQGASLTLSNSPTGNFRFGDSATAGVDATNILDLSGTLTILPYPSTSDKFQMGSSTDPSEQNIVNLLPGGVLRTRQVVDQAGSSLSSFNFNGGTLSPNTNDFANNFFLGVDALNVLDGGAIIDTAGWDISIGLALTGVGHVGLAKQGAGKLTLNPLGFYSSYTGDTLIKAGTLALANSENLAGSTNIIVGAGATFDLVSTGTYFSMVPGQILSGNGNVSGNVFLDPAAIIAPGSPFGALTFDLPPSLTGIVVMHISKTGSIITNSVLVLTGGNALAFGGRLVVINVGAPLASGDTIKLFDAANYANAFATMTLPALVQGLSWDSSALSFNGTLKVIGTAIQPKFNPTIVRNGANLLLSGSGGTTGRTYYVVSSPSLSLPLSSWTRVATNIFDASGNFTFTNLMNTSVPARFFNLQLP